VAYIASSAYQQDVPFGLNDGVSREVKGGRPTLAVGGYGHVLGHALFEYGKSRPSLQIRQYFRADKRPHYLETGIGV
jgi:hypothetical protein